MKARKIYLTGSEVKYLQMLVCADMNIRNAAVIHAVSHGTDYVDPAIDIASSIIEKIDDAKES